MNIKTISSIKFFNSERFGIYFIIFGILLQIFSFWLTGSSWLSLVSGISGIAAVVLCAERKISFYFFAWIQLITYVLLSIKMNLYGEIAENIFYAVTMLYGMFLWNKNRDKEDTSKVSSNKLQFGTMQIILYFGTIAVLGIWWLLRMTNDTQPFMDSVSTVPAFIAQILMICAFREQWYFWLIVNISSMIMWGIADDWNMVSQFLFWTINCFYGLNNWKKY